jgi:beta-xylosidase
MRTFFAWCYLLSFMSAVAAPQTIRPEAIWPDDRGKRVQAHGGGIIKVGDTYYWFGEDRSKENDPNLRYIACYASTDLAHWQFRNQVVKADDPAKLGPGWVLERPKVFQDAAGHYVMYTHIDNKDYKYAHVALFTCDTVDGDYKYLKDFSPLGHESRDIGQFIDDDGAAYLIFEDRPFGFRIAKLSDDRLSLEKEVHFFPKEKGGALEGGALVQYDGLYYVVGSRMTGWDANPNQYATATNLEGPWSDFKDIAPPALNTYDSQSSMLLKVVGTKTTTVIFMGDMWRPDFQWNSRYLWMPLKIGDGKMALPPPRPWFIDVATGEAGVTLSPSGESHKSDSQ